MFKSLAIASLVAGAAAFAPAQQGSSSVAAKAFADGMVGSEGVSEGKCLYIWLE